MHNHVLGLYVNCKFANSLHNQSCDYTHIAMKRKMKDVELEMNYCICYHLIGSDNVKLSNGCNPKSVIVLDYKSRFEHALMRSS